MLTRLAVARVLAVAASVLAVAGVGYCSVQQERPASNLDRLRRDWAELESNQAGLPPSSAPTYAWLVDDCRNAVAAYNRDAERSGITDWARANVPERIDAAGFCGPSPEPTRAGAR